MNDKRPAKRIVEGTTLERVRYWYREGEDKIDLTPVEEKQRQRWELAYHIMRKHRSQEVTAQMLTRLAHISIATARRDVSSANALFGGIIEGNKAMDRVIMSEYAHYALNWARKTRDLKGYNTAVKNLAIIKGLDKDDSNMPDFTNIESQNNIIIVADPEAVGLKVPDNLDKLISSYNKKQKAQIINIDPLQDGE